MGFAKEFKDFATKGNVIDMAVGFIVGGAFKTIVSSLVNDIVMPPIGMALGGVNFKSLYFSLNDQSYETMDAAMKAGAPIIRYGAFTQTIIDFLIISLALFVMLKTFNKMSEMRKKEEEAEKAAEPPEDTLLLREIRDSLKKPN